MAKYRHGLPQLGEGFFLADGGMETTLIFLDKLELPDFAAFQLLKNAEGIAALRKYFRAYGAIARRYNAGLVLESATWRASADWAARLGFTHEALAAANRQSIELLEAIRAEFESADTKVVISGCVGPRGDGYSPAKLMSAEEAENYHGEQIEVFATTAADLVTAITLNYVEEAIGIVRAARRCAMPVVISFTIETDGVLPTGQSLRAAIEQVDAATSSYACYYMINCAHPTHFEKVLMTGEPWLERIRGLRANASRQSHAELNESPDLDIGDPVELGAQYAQLKTNCLPQLNVMGGCCGTDDRHVEEIAKACAPLFDVKT
ncbi:MAG: homocysteine S-methyltransferase [Deltaproteobacteria bacterium]|nr:homocysteine S-methyltransferase [Deltaproteobacteria bacterium]